MKQPNTAIRKAAEHDFERARKAANLESVLDVFRSSKANLLAFEDVREKLRLEEAQRKGLQDVPINQIRGSLGRYNDFTASFMPKKDFLKDRWESVDAATYQDGFPPIEVYQVGDAYFVVDGNHRVSVAKMKGLETIPGYVSVFDSPIGLSADADMNEVFLKAEYAAFLEKTGLNKMRPDMAIELTVPGKYRELEYQIEMFAGVLETIDREKPSYEYTVEMWYDLVYDPATDLIQESNTLERFPNRTEADLYVWTWEHRQHLLDSGQEVGLRTALRTLPEEEKSSVKEAVKKISGVFRKADSDGSQDG